MGLHGYGAKSKNDEEVLCCVVTRLEIGSVKALGERIDRGAFVAYHPLAHAEGGLIKKNELF